MAPFPYRQQRFLRLSLGLGALVLLLAAGGLWIGRAYRPGAPEPPTAISFPSPVPTPTPLSTLAALPLAGIRIGIDPGHQLHADRKQEPVAPGSSETKNRVSSGTRGASSGVPEHEVTLSVGLLLRDLLTAQGAEVFMTRTKADVDISNSERAVFFNDYQVDLGIRLHCNGSDDEAVRGAFMLVPADKAYPYYRACQLAAEKILDAYGQATGIPTDKGITYRDDQAGFNWCQRPVVNIEMGHLTNPEEERLLIDTAFQKTMAQGIYNGIFLYFQQSRLESPRLNQQE